MDGHQCEHAVRARGLDHRPQRQVDVAAGERDERLLNSFEVAGGLEQLLDVRFAEDQDLTARDSRIVSPSQRRSQCRSSSVTAL